MDLEQLQPKEDTGVNKTDCEQFVKSLVENGFDSETVLDDLDDADNDQINDFEDSNLFPLLKNNKFFTKIVKKHLGGDRNDDDKLPSFSFGEQLWMHWP